jgi:hypothetical protein
MAENKKSFVMYTEWKEVFSSLSNEQAGKLIKHIFSYVNDENPRSSDPITNIAFIQIKQQFKRDLKKYEAIIERNRLNGSKGGRPKKRNPENPMGYLETQNNPDEPNHNPKNPIKDKGKWISDKGKVIKDKKKSREERKSEFANSLPPYIDQKFTKQDARDFFEYWTEHGPKDRKMRFEKEKSFSLDRRVKTWLKNKKEFGPKDQPQTVSFKNKI